ncbi:MAG: Non-ous end joining protein Ku [Bacteroidetes bacterium]|nr:Non-ous end joining protein Ku [Bacteroidota bacterium]
MRAIWKGYVRFSLVTIPVRVYNAVDTEQRISFNQLHKNDNGQIGYEKKCKKCGKTVAMEDIVKGYQYEPDQYAVVEKDDIEKIKLKSTKVIEIEGFISAKEVSPMLYESPYFAGPDGPVASKAFALLSQTLKETGKVGIGKVVLRDREDVVLIAPQEGGIVLYKLRYPSEVRAMKDVPQLDGQVVDKNQLKLARNLVDSMAKAFKKLDLTDTYHDALRKMIEAKIEGKEVVTVEEEPKAVVDIMSALKQSIDQAKSHRKPMEKAKGEKKKVAAKAVKTKRAKVG